MRCRLYGLGVEVDVPLAALAGLPASGRIDLRCRLGAMPDWYAGVPAQSWRAYGGGPSAPPAAESCVRASRLADGSHFRLEYADGTVFVIEARGRILWATWPSPATLDDTATYLLGPVMGFLLRLHGTPCLHASAVAVDGAAVVLAGHSGAGKSSVAAAFARLGYPVLSDDVAALAADREGIRVQPAYPRVRMWPESVAAMFGSEDALPRLTPTWSKRYLGLGGVAAPFQRDALALDAIYIFDDRRAGLSAPEIEVLPARTALLWLVGHSYVTYLLDRKMRAREFELLGRIAAEVPVARVVPPDDIGLIEVLCAAIARDARARRPGRAPGLRARAVHASL